MISARDRFHINAPGLMTPRERARDALVTAVMWMFYLYLWVPLISLLAWLLGFEFAYEVMVRSGGARELGNVLTFYAIIITVIFCVVTAWSISNRIRFRQRQRRRKSHAVTTAEMAEHFAIETGLIEQLRKNKISELRFDADGSPQL